LKAGDLLALSPPEEFFITSTLKRGHAFSYDKEVRRIPVVGENGTLRGIISMRDVAVETEADRELAEALEDISKESSFWSRLFN
jgi:CBS domain-containing protein